MAASKNYEQVLSGLPPEDQAIIKDAMQREGDRRANDAIRTHEKNHPSAGDAAASLALRLDTVEKALQSDRRSAELRFFKYKAAIEANIPFHVIEDLQLSDEKAIEDKVRQIVRTIEDGKAEEARKTASMGLRPGSGNVSPSGPDPRRWFTQGEQSMLESMGRWGQVEAALKKK